MRHRKTLVATAVSAIVGSSIVLPSQRVWATTLDEIVVSGSREGTEVRNTPATIHKVSEEELARDKPVFFGEVVNRVPGVYVNNLGAEQHMASIRQPISTQGVYLYLEDGVPVRPAGLFNHNQVYEVNMGGIGSVEVIKGPASSLYGSYATGGLMNFLTKAPSALSEASAGLQASDRGYKRLDFGLSGRSDSGQHAYRLSGYGFDQRDGWAKHSDADKQALTFRHDMDMGTSRVLKTILTHTSLYSQMGGTISQAQWDAGQIGESPQTFTFRDVTATRLSSSLEAEFNPGGLTTLMGFYRKNETNQVPTFRLIPGAGTGSTLDQAFETFGVDVRHRQMIGERGSKVVVGFVYDQGDMSGNEQGFTFTNSAGRYINKSPNTSVLRDYTTDFYNAGVYSQAEIVLKPGLIAVAGARYDTIEYDYTRLPGQGNLGVPSGKTTYSGFSPKLGVVFSPTAASSYFANISTGFAPPEITTRYGGNTIGTVEEARTTSKELGMRTLLVDKRLSLDVAVYELDMTNAIYSDEQSTTYNADSRHRGLEIGLDMKATKRLEVSTSIAFTEQVFTSAPRNPAGTSRSGNDLRYAPETVSNAQARYRFSDKTRGSLEAEYISDYWMNETNTTSYSGHLLIHARLTHYDGPWEYWLALRNATDRKYAEFATVTRGSSSYNPGAPRTVLAGVRYNFGGKAK